MWQLAWIHFYGKFSQHLGLERGACLKHAGTGKGNVFLLEKRWMARCRETLRKKAKVKSTSCV